MCLIAISKESMSAKEQEDFLKMQDELLKGFQELEEKARKDGENRGCIRSEETTERASRKKSSSNKKAQVKKSKRGSRNSSNSAASEYSGAVGTTENGSSKQTSSEISSSRASTGNPTFEPENLTDEEFPKRFNKNHRKIEEYLEESDCIIL
ncbi:hypothetical protein CWI38_0051p0040 [Hamiltosporidium tvaerminnensis]|uniref:Uncharacterized protein n=1 Tax=Hamiltosporidium tvaerminnensis TaxID=1176355 RepID=A0A4Q9M1E2_9MICR|nr:hypothetical protein CWI38_0063p0050 [Hamiltosporidium tvaerminnensis]TBU20559.1 hypothetical protein CWI38_0051p0040 [Hamiltosporidium tvaerminnensis]